MAGWYVGTPDLPTGFSRAPAGRAPWYNPSITPTIDILDDEPDWVFMLALTLELRGFTTEQHTCPIGFLEQYTPKAGCVLMGIMMPDLSGTDVMAEMHSQGWTVPVITLSGTGTARPTEFSTPAGSRVSARHGA